MMSIVAKAFWQLFLSVQHIKEQNMATSAKSLKNKLKNKL